MYKWAVVTPVNDELRLKEWILYYKKLQVDMFIIIDDYSKIPVKTYFEELNIDNYEIIMSDHICMTGYATRGHAMRGDAIKNNVLPVCNKHKIDYILYIDADEFLYLNNFHNIQDVINFYHPFDELRINWLLFNHNEVKINETNSLVNTFTSSQQYINKYIKSFIKVSSIITGNNAHHCNLIEPYIAKDIFNTIIVNPISSCVVRFNFDDIDKIHYKNCPLFIAHYVYKCISSFVERKCCKDDLNMNSIFTTTDDNFEYKNQIKEFHQNNKDDVVDYIYLIIKDHNTQEELNNIQNLEDKHYLLKQFKNAYYYYYYHIYDDFPYVLNVEKLPNTFFEYKENLCLKKFIA